MRIFFYHLIYLFVFNSFTGFLVNAQCTEAKEPDMAKYKRLTETQDAQACSQCAMLALYFCSAKHCVDVEDKRKVRSLIEACKGNIRNMGQPYCCPELVNKEPQWGIAIGSGNTSATSSNSTSETTQEELEEGFQELTEGSQTNPDNPLGVTPQMLNEIASLIPNENLKSVLEGYANNLGSNQDVSFRQVYNDLLTAFDLNPAIGMTNDYSSKQGALDLMFNQPLAFQSFFEKSGIASSAAEARLFSITTQAMLTNYQNVTAADALGAVSDLITMYAEDAARQKALEERFKEMLEIAKKNILHEIDAKLGSALIDANIGHTGHELITPMFRFDSDSGYSIRVENGIIKYINTKLNLTKSLIVVGPKNSPVLFPGYESYNFIRVSEESQKMLLRVVDLKKSLKRYRLKCVDCLKDGLYILDLTDGSIVWKTNKFENNGLRVDWFSPDDILFTKNEINIYRASELRETIYKSKYSINPSNIEVAVKLFNSKQFSFDFNGQKPYRSILDEEYTNSNNIQYNYTIDSDNFQASLLWGSIRNSFNSTTDFSRKSSSLFIVSSFEGYVNNDAMKNELTGLVKSKSGDLYVTDINGRLGVLRQGTFRLNDPEITGLIRKSLIVTGLPKYDFSAMSTPIIPNGNGIETDFYAKYPRLFLSPDDKWLLYTIKDELFVIDPNDFSKVKSFKLTNEPHRSYFGKENGDWVLYLQTINELQFPITKKYSMKRLTYDPPAPKITEPTPAVSDPKSTKKTSTKSSSNAKNKATSTKSKTTTTAPATPKTNSTKEDELQRLIELYTKGLITEDEFKKAKAKLSE